MFAFLFFALLLVGAAFFLAAAVKPKPWMMPMGLLAWILVPLIHVGMKL